MIGERDDLTPPEHCLQWAQAAPVAGGPIESGLDPAPINRSTPRAAHYAIATETRNRDKPGGCCGAILGTDLKVPGASREHVARFLSRDLRATGISRPDVP